MILKKKLEVGKNLSFKSCCFLSSKSGKFCRGGARGSSVRARGFEKSYRWEPEAMVYEPEAMVYEPEAMV